MLLRTEDHANSLLFVEAGVLELYTNFEGNEFIIQRLYRGSALNSRAFFMEDLMYVYVRCAKNSIILELEQKTIESIKSQHQDFEKSIMAYQH